MPLARRYLFVLVFLAILGASSVQAQIFMPGGGSVSDAQVPDLGNLSTGMLPNRCVETDATGKLAVAAAVCGFTGATTGISSGTNHGLMLATGSTTGTSLGIATNGQIPIGSTGLDPVLALPQGTPNQIRITPGPGSLLFDFPPAGVTLPGTTTGTFSGPLTGLASTAAALQTDPIACLTSPQQVVIDISAAGTLTCQQLNFTDLSGTASDAQIPDLNTLTTGLAMSRCVQTNGIDGKLTVATGPCGLGTGDVSTLTAVSIDNELALFSGTGGKTLKRATVTGMLKANAGVLSTALAGTDFVIPGTPVVDAQVPDLSSLSSGLAPSLCVETDSTGHLTTAAAPCGTGTGGGGTGISGATLNGAMYATSSTTATSTAALTDGQLLIGRTGNAPVASGLSGTPNQIRVTPGPGTITFDFPPTLNVSASVLLGGTPLVFDGVTPDGNTTTVVVTNPTAGRTFTLPDANSVAVQPQALVPNEFVTTISPQGVVSTARPSVATLSDSGNVVLKNAVNAFVGAGALTGLPTPTSPSDAATKNYVDSLTAGFSPVDGVRVATTGAFTSTYTNGALGVGSTLTNTGTLAALAVDGVTMNLADRVLVKNQVTPAQNGIYSVTTVGSVAIAWVLTRTTDFDEGSETIAGSYTVVGGEGTANKNTVWMQITTGAITMGTTPLVFNQLGATTPPLTNLPSGVIQDGTIKATAIAPPAAAAAGFGNVYFETVSQNYAVKDSVGVVKHMAQTVTPTVSQWLRSMDDAGLFTKTQPAFTDLSGTASAAQIPNLSTLTTGLAGNLCMQTDGAGKLGVTTTPCATGTGDVSTLTAVSIDSEIALFSGVGGKTLKRATTTGVLKANSGVLAQAVAGTDYVLPSGLVATATALAADPIACLASPQRVVVDFAANGTLVCQQLAFADLSGSATDAQIPDLNTLTSGLPPNLCVQTNGTDGKLSVAAGPCGVSSGTVTVSGTPTPGWTAEWVSTTAIQAVQPTGTGQYVKNTNPVLTTPNLGQPSFLNLANATNLPLANTTGTLSCTQFPTLLGNVTSAPGTCTTTVANLPSAVPASGSILFTAIAAPGPPAAGLGVGYFDTVSTNWSIKNSAGVIKHGVQSKARSGTEFLTAIADDGTVSALVPAFSDLSGSLACTQSPGLVAGGDVTAAPGTCVATLGNNTVTLAKMADIATGSILGRVLPGTGDPQALTAAEVKTLLALTFTDLGASVATDAQIPDLNTLTSGLPISRCVQTNGTDGKLTVTAGPCAAGLSVNGVPTAGQLTVWHDSTTVKGVNTLDVNWAAAPVTLSGTVSTGTEYVTTGAATITRTLPPATSGTSTRRYLILKVDSGVGTLTLAAAGGNTLSTIAGGAVASVSTTTQWSGWWVYEASTTTWFLEPVPGGSGTLMLNVKDFGAQGDGVADDAPAINATIQALPATGGTVVFPRGDYRINSSINIMDTTAGNNRKGVTLQGMQSGGSGFSTVRILWNGTTTDPMVKMHSRDNVIRHISFELGAGKTTDAAIDIDRTLAAGQGNVTNNSFYHVRISGLGGTMTDAVRNGISNQVNQEFYHFEKCYFTNFVRAGFYQPNPTGQGKHHIFLDTNMNVGQYGIYLESGSFSCYSCGIGQMSVANFRLGTATDQITIANTDSEGSARFLITAGGSVQNWPVSILGGRINLTGLHPDGQFIQWTWGGPLTIQGVLFGEAVYTPTFKILAGSGAPAAQLVSIGNVFPNDDPYTSSTGHLRLTAVGNRGRTVGDVVVLLDDQVTDLGGSTVGKLRLQTVTGLSGSAVHAQNLRGSLTVTSGATTGVVTFPTAEPDTSYYLQVTPSWNTSMWITGKTTSGFTVNVGTAPGANSPVDWFLVR